MLQKHLDNNLEGAEIIEFDKYLENPDYINYLEDAELANKIMEKGMRQMLADPEIMKELMADLDFDKKTEDDILRFGKKRRQR